MKKSSFIMMYVHGDRFLEAMAEFTVTELKMMSGVSEATIRNYQDSRATKPHTPSMSILRKLDRVLPKKHDYYVVFVPQLVYTPQPQVLASGLFGALAQCSAVPVDKLQLLIAVDYRPRDSQPWGTIGEGIAAGAEVLDVPPISTVTGESASLSRADDKTTNPLAQDFRVMLVSSFAPPLGGKCAELIKNLATTTHTFPKGETTGDKQFAVVLQLQEETQGAKLRVRLQIVPARRVT